MKKALNIALIVSGGMLILGIICVVIGSLFGGQLSWGVGIGKDGTKEFAGNIVDGEVMCESFDSIVSHTHSANIYLKPGDDYKVSYHVLDMDVPNIKVEDGVLYLDQKENISVSFISPSLNEESYIIITVPEGEQKVYDVDMSITSDKLDIEKVNIDGALEMTSGELILKDSDAKDVKIEMTSGNTDIENVTMDSVKLELSSGDVNFSNISANTISIKQTSGSVSGEKVNVNTLDCVLTSGDIDMKIIGKEADYDYSFDKTSGDINYAGNDIDEDIIVNNNRDKKIDVRLTSGSFSVSFSEN